MSESIQITDLNTKADSIPNNSSTTYRYLVVDEKGITRLIHAAQVIPLGTVNSYHLTNNVINCMDFIDDNIVNKANGLVKLDDDARISPEFLPVTAMEFKGFKRPEELEDLKINSNDGDIYMMSQDGYYCGKSYKLNDWAIYSNADWHRVHNNVTDQVTCAQNASNLGNYASNCYVRWEELTGGEGGGGAGIGASHLTCNYIKFGDNCIWIGE